MQKCSNNLRDFNILGIDCTIVNISVTQYSKKLTKPSSTQSLIMVEFKQMQSLSHHIFGVQENHNTPTLKLPASPKLMITYLFSARTRRSGPSCMSILPLFLPAISLSVSSAANLSQCLILPLISASVAPAEQTFLQMAPGTSQ